MSSLKNLPIKLAALSSLDFDFDTASEIISASSPPYLSVLLLCMEASSIDLIAALCKLEVLLISGSGSGIGTPYGAAGLRYGDNGC